MDNSHADTTEQKVQSFLKSCQVCRNSDIADVNIASDPPAQLHEKCQTIATDGRIIFVSEDKQTGRRLNAGQWSIVCSWFRNVTQTDSGRERVVS